MLNTLQNFSTNGFPAEMLTIVSTISLLFGILVINSKNPIVSVLFLIGLFLGIASYLFFLGMHFLGMSYLLVYVGAVSILFLFILMLINVRVSELSNTTKNSFSLGFLISVFFCIVLYQILPNSDTYNNLVQLIENINTNVIFYVSGTSWDKNLAETSHITSIGNILYTVYSMWIILTAIILLLAMVGAIAITIKQKVSDMSQYNVIKPLVTKQSSIITLPMLKISFLVILLFCLNIGEDFFSVLPALNIDTICLESVPNIREGDPQGIMIITEIEITEGEEDGTPLGTTTTITAGNHTGTNGVGISGDTEPSAGVNGHVNGDTNVNGESNEYVNEDSNANRYSSAENNR